MKPKITDRFRFHDTELELHVVETDDRTFIVLYGHLQGRSVVQAWSQKPDQEGVSVDEVIDFATLLGHRRVRNAAESISWWPVGWDYWGHGVPAPLDDLYQAGNPNDGPPAKVINHEDLQ